MLPSLTQLKYGAYGFRFKGPHQERVVGMHSIGYEKQTDPFYDWDGLTRTETDIIVFQYTLKGSGRIIVGEEESQLNEGDAFFVKVPSQHRYFLPEVSEEWKFIHISLFGHEALKCYEEITKISGYIFHLTPNSTPISAIVQMLSLVSANELHDAYESSSLAYSFLMELQRYLSDHKKHKEWPLAISKAITFINTNYGHPIVLDDIVETSGLSKYHFTRLFHATIHATPIQYLTSVRINKSIDLLKNKNLTVEDIALKVGFSNGNYFGKVFRASLGIAPGEYRNTKSFIPVDHLIGDY